MFKFGFKISDIKEIRSIEDAGVFFEKNRDALKKLIIPLLIIIVLIVFFITNAAEKAAASERDSDAEGSIGMSSELSSDGTYEFPSGIDNIDPADTSSSDMQEANGLTERTSSGQATIYVDICGEVNAPGVYEIAFDSRLFQLIDLAGGLTEYADTGTVNRAEKVYDGEKIIIGSVREDGVKTAHFSSGSSYVYDENSADTNAKVNINYADSEALESLPNIGASKAQRIIEYRTENGSFKTIDDIKNVPGIGSKTFDELSGHITV